MNEQGSFIATLLDSAARAYAAGAVNRMRERPGESNLLDLWPFGQVVADTELRIRHLSEALAAGRPEVFHLDVDWLRSTYDARGLSAGVLETTLECLRDELVESLPDQAVETTRQYLDGAIARLGQGPSATESLLEVDAPHVDLARSFLLAVLEGRRRDAGELVLDALDRGTTIPELHEHVIVRAQAEIGRMWQVGEVNIAEEHMGSRIVEEVLVLLRARMPQGRSNGLSVITASVTGNLHDIGARIVADHFEMAGWSSLFLGADMPAVDLVRAIRAFDAKLVALSVGLGLNVRATADMIETIRGSGITAPIIVGGRPFTAVPELWKDVGADGWAADAAGAVRVGARLAS